MMELGLNKKSYMVLKETLVLNTNIIVVKDCKLEEKKQSPKNNIFSTNFY